MATAIIHRSPDDEGIYVGPHFARSLSARRLSLIHVASGHQPIDNKDSSVWPVLKGEIYTYTSLRDRMHKG